MSTLTCKNPAAGKGRTVRKLPEYIEGEKFHCTKRKHG